MFIRINGTDITGYTGLLKLTGRTYSLELTRRKILEFTGLLELTVYKVLLEFTGLIGLQTIGLL